MGASYPRGRGVVRSAETAGGQGWPLLDAAGRWYLPLLQANAEAGVARQPGFQVPIDGVTWVGTTDRYKLKCLAWLRDELAALPAPALAGLRPLLERHGCWDVLRPSASPVLAVPPMAPL
jgi:hypothetical protein